MNTQVFSDAMSELNEKYIMEAASFKRSAKENRRKWKWWASLAACLTVVAIGFGLIPILNQPAASPFIITAYAMEDGAVGSPMTVGEHVPVSLFETKNGIKCFVFSRDSDDPNSIPSSSIVTDGEIPNVIEEVMGLETEKGKIYTLYVPNQEQAAPYTFMLLQHSEDEKYVYQYDLLIEENDDGYTAVIERVVTNERRDAPPVYH